MRQVQLKTTPIRMTTISALGDITMLQRYVLTLDILVQAGQVGHT
jgi:hypothetical protein